MAFASTARAGVMRDLCPLHVVFTASASARSTVTRLLACASTASVPAPKAARARIALAFSARTTAAGAAPAVSTAGARASTALAVPTAPLPCVPRTAQVTASAPSRVRSPQQPLHCPSFGSNVRPGAPHSTLRSSPRACATTAGQVLFARRPGAPQSAATKVSACPMGGVRASTDGKAVIAPSGVAHKTNLAMSAAASRTGNVARAGGVGAAPAGVARAVSAPPVLGAQCRARREGRASSMLITGRRYVRASRPTRVLRAKPPAARATARELPTDAASSPPTRVQVRARAPPAGVAWTVRGLAARTTVAAEVTAPTTENAFAPRVGAGAPARCPSARATHPLNFCAPAFQRIRRSRRVLFGDGRPPCRGGPAQGCGLHGTCDKTTRACICAVGWTGAGRSRQACPGNGRGIWDRHAWRVCL